MTDASIKSYNPYFWTSYCSGVHAAFLTTLRPPRLSYCATERRPVPSAAECNESESWVQNPGQHHALLDSDQTGGKKESRLPDETEGCQFMQQLICMLGYKEKSQHMLSFIPPHHSVWFLQCFKEQRRVARVNKSKTLNTLRFGLEIIGLIHLRQVSLIRYLSAQPLQIFLVWPYKLFHACLVK